MKTKGLYIHIPFCRSRCLYCDFTAYRAGEQQQREFTDLLKKELLMEDGDFIIDTLYIGGGTPSILYGEEIREIIDLVVDRYDTRLKEATIEMNPEDVTAEKLGLYREAGIDRISLGVQSFNDRLLHKVGRRHGKKETEEAVKKIRDAGFDNLSFDLIFGLPGQTTEDLVYDLEEIERLSPDHISWYNLIVEDDAPLYRMLRRGMTLPSEDEQAGMYEFIIKSLADKGYHQYEISNFAKDHKESLHNMKYWKYRDYLGFGPGATGTVYPVRTRNFADYSAYRDKILKKERPVAEREVLTEKEMAFEAVIMAMRMNRGLDLSAYERRFGFSLVGKNKKLIDSFVETGHLKPVTDRLAFTGKGFEISNSFFRRLEI